MNNVELAQDWIASAKLTLLGFAELMYEGYEANWHHEVVADHLEAVFNGDIRTLIICEPNRYGKTLECSELFPAWYLGHKPDTEVMLASYSDTLAGNFGKETRDIMESELYREVFPKTRIRQDSRASDDWRTIQGGRYKSVGRGGSAEGVGWDLLIIDDLIKNPEEAESKTYQDKIWNFYISVLKRRANKPKEARKIIPMTRWGRNDVIGKIIEMAKESGEEIVVLNFPAQAMEDEVWESNYGTFKRKKGEPLWPRQHNKEQLEQAKIEMGRWWGPRFQQIDNDDSLSIVKRKWLEDFEYEELPLTGTKFISIDSAFQKKETADYSAFGEYLDTGQEVYKSNQWQERLSFDELEDYAIHLFITRQPEFFLIEDKASGQSLVQVLQDREIEVVVSDKGGNKQAVKKRIRVLTTSQIFKECGISPNISKMEKGDICQSIIRTGGFRTPKFAPWKEEFYSNITGFPNMPHDDIWDETMQAIIYAHKRPRAGVWGR